MNGPSRTTPGSALVLPYGGVWPRLHGGALVLPGAAVIGDVVLGADSSVWFGAVLRGDDGPIRIGRASNLQDGTMVHVDSAIPTLVGDHVTVGHRVHLHACTLEDESLVGSGAIVLDGAVVERHGQVAAGALVAPGKAVRAGELWAGVPARKLRDLGPEERAAIRDSADRYVEKAGRYREALERLG